MESLSLLENKIKSLIELVNKLKKDNCSLNEKNAQLVDENSQLSQEIRRLGDKVETFRSSTLEHDKDLEELSQEKKLTKMVVEDLIKNIDSFVAKEDKL